MKKIFTLSAFALLISVFLGSCVKTDYNHFDERYWLAKERGEVVYSDSYCSYYVVDTYSGYSVIRAFGGYKPYEGSIIYGDLSYTGTKDMYNRTTGLVFTGTITDTGLSYLEAQDALNYYCPLKNGQAREFKQVAK